MSKNINFSIFGDCVSHEIAAIYPHLSAMGLMNPISINHNCTYIKSLDKDIDNLKISKYEQRICKLDLNKNAFKYLSKESDYLLIDLNDIRKDILKIFINNDAYLLFTVNRNIKDYDLYINSFFENFKKEIISTTSYDLNFIQKNVFLICDKLKNFYSDEQIILHIHYPVSTYTDNLDIFDFDYSSDCFNEKTIRLMKLTNLFFIKKFPRCHVIKFPIQTLAYKYHHFGCFPLHYHPLYYRYGKDALDIILQGFNKETETNLLDGLLSEINQEFYSLRTMIQSKNKINLINKKNRYHL